MYLLYLRGLCSIGIGLNCFLILLERHEYTIPALNRRSRSQKFKAARGEANVQDILRGKGRWVSTWQDERITKKVALTFNLSSLQCLCSRFLQPRKFFLIIYSIAFYATIHAGKFSRWKTCRGESTKEDSTSHLTLTEQGMIKWDAMQWMKNSRPAPQAVSWESSWMERGDVQHPMHNVKCCLATFRGL